MVLPLTVSNRVLAKSTIPPYGRVVFAKYSVGYNQSRPYNLDTPVIIQTFTGDGNVAADAWDWRLDDPRWGNFPDLKQATSNLAYKRLVGKLGDSSSFGATLTAERKETFGMIVGTITRAALAAKAVTRLDLAKAANLLGIPYRERTIRTRRYTHRKDGSIRRTIVSRKRVFTLPTGREVQKTLANGWLMYSYGVKPLMGDLYNGMDVLQRPFPFTRVRGSAEAKGENGWFTTGTYVSQKSRKLSVSYRCSCEVSVENPNLWLANKMGLVNPVQWINEAIPFSFVVDWFSNLSDVIMSSTDFVGLTVRNPRTICVFTQFESTFGSGPFGKNPSSSWKKAVTFRRDLSLVTPQLRFAYERFEWQRGLNAISLLTQFLPTKR